MERKIRLSLSMPKGVGKFFKWVVNSDLVIPNLVAANSALDDGSTKERTNVRLGAQTLKEGRQTQPFIVFRPDRVN
jgi:hypothetical protein